MEQTIDMESLVGKHILSGVDEENRKIEQYFGRFEDCQCINFVLDGITYTAIEDPDDGYRSSLDQIIVSTEKVQNLFEPIEVLVTYRDKDFRGWACEILDFVDTKNGKQVMEIGTDYSDDYYPSLVASFMPENMSTNDDKLESV